MPEMMFTVTVKVGAHCAKCGALLRPQDDRKAQYGAIDVFPCEQCLERERNRAYIKGYLNGRADAGDDTTDA